MAFYIKITPEAQRDIESMKSLVVNHFYYKIKQLRKKGKAAFNKTIKIGRNGDDFAKDLLTVICTFTVYKKPRFIK